MPRVKHWVGYDNEGRPINVPEIDLKPTGVWHRHDGYGGTSLFFTVWNNKRIGNSMILQSNGREPEMKPYLRQGIDVFLSVVDRLKHRPEISIEADLTGSGRIKPIEGDGGLRLCPFTIHKNREKTTMTERRIVFKYIKAIIAEESSWDPKVAVYEKSHDANKGFLLYYDRSEEEDRS